MLVSSTGQRAWPSAGAVPICVRPHAKAWPWRGGRSVLGRRGGVCGYARAKVRPLGSGKTERTRGRMARPWPRPGRDARGTPARPDRGGVWLQRGTRATAGSLHKNAGTRWSYGCLRTVHRLIGRQHNTRGCRERAATTVAYRFGSRTEGWRRRDEALPCRVGAVQVEPERRRSRS